MEKRKKKKKKHRWMKVWPKSRKENETDWMKDRRDVIWS